MDLESLLRRTYLCAELDGKELKQVLQIVETRRLKRGEILFYEGAPATGFFLLLEGRVRIYKSSTEGKEYTLHIIQPGQMFAEAALFSGRGFPAHCAALEDARVAHLPKDRFLALLEQSPRISLKMITGLSAFVREFNQKVEELSLKEVSARLAAYIIREKNRRAVSKFDLEISKGELASKLGTISETLSRNFKKLKDLGCIEVSGRTIIILDETRLDAIAAGEKI
jgi:CRP/FNR family transcriptional regulator